MKCKTHSCIKPRGGYEFHEKIKKEFTQDPVANYRQLAAIGIGLDKAPVMAREHKKALEATHYGAHPDEAVKAIEVVKNNLTLCLSN